MLLQRMYIMKKETASYSKAGYELGQEKIRECLLKL